MQKHTYALCFFAISVAISTTPFSIAKLSRMFPQNEKVVHFSKRRFTSSKPDKNMRKHTYEHCFFAFSVATSTTPLSVATPSRLFPQNEKAVYFSSLRSSLNMHYYCTVAAF